MIATWDNVKDRFAWDGGVRDIYVLETTLADWQSFLDWLHRLPYSVTLSVDGIDASLPAAADEVFEMAREACLLMALNLSGIQIHCHFFAQSELELDLDPRQIGAQQLPDLLGFLAGLGDELHKDVQLTYENDRGKPFLVYDHKAKVNYCPW